MLQKIRKTSGYTLVELMVAAALFATMITIIGTIMVNFYQAQRKQKIASDLYEESRYLMERVVREARVNTLDFQEYLSFRDHSGSYGFETNNYEDHFWCYYNDGTIDKRLRNEGMFDTDANTDCLADNDRPDDSAIDDEEQSELYLVSADGRTKTIIKRIGNGVDDDNDGIIDDRDDTDTGEEWIAISKMVVEIDDAGNLVWVPHSDFLSNLDQASCYASVSHSWIGVSGGININRCLEFISITPPEVEVTNLVFYVAPLEDPRKAFNENGPNIQMQPHVSILFEAQTARQLARSIKGLIPNISLQTTVSTRIYHNVFFPET